LPSFLFFKKQKKKKKKKKKKKPSRRHFPASLEAVVSILGKNKKKASGLVFCFFRVTFKSSIRERRLCMDRGNKARAGNSETWPFAGAIGLI